LPGRVEAAAETESGPESQGGEGSELSSVGQGLFTLAEIQQKRRQTRRRHQEIVAH
jgi:hypothetical protein